MNDNIPGVLVVDDSREITELIHNFALHYDKEFRTIVTNKPEHVLRIIEDNEDIRLVVTDFKMPSINGLELIIRVKERRPEIQFIMMTGYGSPALRREVEERGIVRYMEKPFRINELIKAIRETIHKAGRGFDGVVTSLQLPDIIQLIALSGGDAVLEIIAGPRQGKVFFRKGELVHAACGEMVGAEAFCEMFLWKSGRFVVSDVLPDVPQTVTRSWQSLLLDAARLEDETRAGAALEEEQAAAAVAPEPESAAEPAAEAPLPEAESQPSEPPPAAPQPSPPESAVQQPVEAVSPLERLHFLQAKKVKAAPEPPPAPVGEATRTTKPTPAPAAVPRLQLPPRGDMGLEDLEGVLERTVEHYLTGFPSEALGVNLSDLPLKTLPGVLQRHLQVYFHHVSTSAFNFTGTPFDFSDPQVSRAAFEFLETLLRTWRVGRNQFRGMLTGAVRFHLAAALAPGAALADLLEEHCGADPGRARSLLSSLVAKRVIHPAFGNLEPRFNEAAEGWDTAAVKPWVAELFKEMADGELLEELTAALDLVLELGSAGRETKPHSLQLETAEAMLEGRGRGELAGRLKAQLGSDSNAAVVGETFRLLLAAASGNSGDETTSTAQTI